MIFSTENSTKDQTQQGGYNLTKANQSLGSKEENSPSRGNSGDDQSNTGMAHTKIRMNITGGGQDASSCTRTRETTDDQTRRNKHYNKKNRKGKRSNGQYYYRNKDYNKKTEPTGTTDGKTGGDKHTIKKD